MMEVSSSAHDLHYEFLELGDGVLALADLVDRNCYPGGCDFLHVGPSDIVKYRMRE